MGAQPLAGSLESAGGPPALLIGALNGYDRLKIFSLAEGEIDVERRLRATALPRD
jgi:hypothetical protein